MTTRAWSTGTGLVSMKTVPLPLSGQAVWRSYGSTWHAGSQSSMASAGSMPGSRLRVNHISQSRSPRASSADKFTQISLTADKSVRPTILCRLVDDIHKSAFGIGYMKCVIGHVRSSTILLPMSLHDCMVHDALSYLKTWSVIC